MYGKNSNFGYVILGIDDVSSMATHAQPRDPNGGKTFICPRQAFRARPHRGIKKRANGREREYEKLESRQGAIRNVRDGLDLVTRDYR
jgi:hypothetical protein